MNCEGFRAGVTRWFALTMAAVCAESVVLFVPNADVVCFGDGCALPFARLKDTLRSLQVDTAVVCVIAIRDVDAPAEESPSCFSPPTPAAGAQRCSSTSSVSQARSPSFASVDAARLLFVFVMCVPTDGACMRRVELRPSQPTVRTVRGFAHNPVYVAPVCVALPPPCRRCCAGERLKASSLAVVKADIPAGDAAHEAWIRGTKLQYGVQSARQNRIAIDAQLVKSMVRSPSSKNECVSRCRGVMDSGCACRR